MVQLQRLEGFYWVARTGGYARAARAFPYPITQPGVHQQVRRLEEELGQRLFERVGRDQVRLTSAGRVLFDFVAPFLERLPDVVRGLQGGELSGTLRIHAAGLVLRHLLPGWLRRLQARHPRVEVALTEMKAADPGLLRSGEADLLVDYLPELPEDLDARVLAEVEAYLVLPSNHPLAKKRRLSLPELKGEPFIAYNADRRLRDLQLGELARLGVHPARVHLADSADAILGFVAAGLGYSVVPSLGGTAPRVAGVVAHALPHLAGRFRIVAAWRKRAQPDVRVEAALALAPAHRG